MPTTNPVPSTDPSDLLFNAGKLDEVVSGSNATYTDRLGISRRTMAGIDAAADVVLGGLGYATPVAYAAGIALTLTTQTVEYVGEVYAPKSSVLPFTTSGTFETAKFRLIQGVASADLASGGGAAMVGYTPSGTGAVATTVQAKLLDTVSVKDFGAKGDGLTDDTAAIQAAIDYVTNGTVFFPAGQYKITSTLKINYNNVTFQNCVNLLGTGQGSSIYWYGPDNVAMIWYEGTTINAGQFSTTVVEKLYFKNQNAANGLIGIRLGNGASLFPVGGGGVANVTIRNNVFIDMAVGIQTEYQSNGINIEENIIRTFSVYGVYNVGSACMRVTKNYFEQGKPASVAVYAEYTAITVSDNLIQSSEIGVTGDILLKNVAGFTINNNYLEHGYPGPSWAILLQNSSSGYIGSNVIQGYQGSDAIYVDPTSRDVNIGPNSFGFFGFPMNSLVKTIAGARNINVIGNQEYILSPVTISNASPAVVASPLGVAGMQNSQKVFFTTSGSLPTGLTLLQPYYVKNVSGASFELSLTPGGASINTSSAGSGVHTCNIVLANAFDGPGFSSFSRGNQIISGGDVVVDAGNGINFSANNNASGMTSEVLTRYEEGVWTPAVFSSGGTIASATATGTYTRVGRQVTLLGEILITGAGTGSGFLKISGLPFNIANGLASGAGREIALTGDACSANYDSETVVALNIFNNVNMVAINRKYTFVITYFA